VVGNICRASPCADTVPALVCLGAEVDVAGPQGHRSLLLEELITGPGALALSSDEIVVAVRVPEPGPDSALVYLKHGIRQAMEIAIVSVATLICGDAHSGVVTRARITLGSVAPTPIRVQAAERLLVKQGISRQTLTEASELAAQSAQPISDIRGSAAYRREMVKVYTRRAVEQAWENLK
jgi:carbon-monoxide dehydrogenase medium subunit